VRVDQIPLLPPELGLNLNQGFYQSGKWGSQVGSQAFPGSFVQLELTSSAPWKGGSLSQINKVLWCLAGAALLVGCGCWACDKKWKHHPPNPRQVPRNVAGVLRLRGHQSFCEAILLSKPKATQQTHVQRLSLENKGDFPYILFSASYRNGGKGYGLSHT
jgi:hypothetical protein